MSIKNKIIEFTKELAQKGCKLVAVSKTQPLEKIIEAYQAGQRAFGENKAQEMMAKYEALPKDIEWHMIGHLQRNKVKSIAHFVHLVQSVDSLRLLEEINKQGEKNNRVIPCLLQIHIAAEESKFGFDEHELMTAIPTFGNFAHVKITGLMGMATFTPDQAIIHKEFKGLNTLFNKLKSEKLPDNMRMETLSMGMSSDYLIAVEEGSTLVRVGTSIFGERNYI